MKQMKLWLSSLLVMLSALTAGVAQADIVADATTKIDELKTSAEAMGTPILGVVAAIVLIGIIVM